MEFVRNRKWQLAGAGALVVAAIVLVIALASTGSNGSNGGSAATESSAPATVLEVGALSGPIGDAMLYIRQEALTDLDLQWLQFSDLDGMVGALKSGTGVAAIVPEGTTLPEGVSEISKLVRINADGADTTYVLVATTENAAAYESEFKTLTESLRSDQVLGYLADTGATATRA